MTNQECDDASLELDHVDLNRVGGIDIDIDDLDDDDVNVHYDFSAWECRRQKSTRTVKGPLDSASTLLVGFGDVYGSDSESEDENTKPTTSTGTASTLEKNSDDALNNPPTNDKAGEPGECDPSFDLTDQDQYESDDDPQDDSEDDEWDTTFDLTDEERFDNAAWRMRITDNSVFNWDYIIKPWERHEMDKIISFLELKPPPAPEDLAQDEHKEQEKMQAITSIFFPQPGDFQSVLLKRGPVLFGEEERELMAFTNGFVLSRVKFESLFYILFNVDSSDEVDELVRRFQEIDTDNNGSLDRGEIVSFFRSIGVALSESSANDLMNKLDPDSDGKITLEEFKSMLKENQEEVEGSRRSITFKSLVSAKSLGSKLKRALSNVPVAEKVDIAFQMSDIERIENKGLRRNYDSSEVMNKIGLWSNKVGLDQLSFTIHIKGLEDPLVVTCAKPGHVEAWMEVFRTCIASLKVPSSTRQLLDCSDRSDSGLINGAGTKPLEKVRTNRISMEKWRGGAVDWGFDD